ncbi:ATP-binding cassette domain-containing protein [Streptomyces sp. NPDC086023]|uniref:ATP-binding cassette domain-containing protein n=1 Tax=Streptomyces sp. NPDC086023 TaxID=3365746 RepID=UPI0037D54D73
MDSPTGAAVKAQGFGLQGPRGWVFQGVDVDAAPGSLIAVEGPSGTGRTCLLLALTGRMKPTAGHAEVGGLRLPKKMAAVRRISGLGPVPGVTDLDPALTVAEQLRERALLQRRYDGPVRALFRPRSERAALTAGRIDAALDAVGLDVAALPKGARTSVRELERLEELRLSLALALISGPGLLAVDDTDLKLSDAERVEAWALLRSLAARGTTVLAVCSEAPADALVIRTNAAGTPGEGDDPAPQDTARRPGTAAAATPRTLPKRKRRAATGTAAAPAAPAAAEESAGAAQTRAGQAGQAGQAGRAGHAGTTPTAQQAPTAGTTENAESSAAREPGATAASQAAEEGKATGTTGSTMPAGEAGPAEVGDGSQGTLPPDAGEDAEPAGTGTTGPDTDAEGTGARTGAEATGSAQTTQTTDTTAQKGAADALAEAGRA